MAIMATQARYCIWEWLDPRTREPVYVGVGKRGADGEHPADLVWRMRFVSESKLSQWLRQFAKQPPRENLSAQDSIYRNTAISMRDMRRRWFRQHGVPMLDDRELGTYAGGGQKRPVFDCDGDLFPSVRKAANEHGVSAAAVTRWCRERRNGWRYLDDEA